MAVGCTLVAMGLAVAAAPATGTAPASENSPRALFERANARYESGEHAEAIGLYRRLVDAGVESAALYYNLGNAYYKVGELGRAILNYERAHRLAPRGVDIAQNLALAHALVRDRQFVGEAGWLRRVVMWPHRNLSTRETFMLTSGWYLLLTLSLLALIFRDTAWVSRLYSRLSMLSPGRLLGLDKTQDFVLAVCTTCLLTAVTGASAYAKYREETERTRGVIVEEEVAVYGGPSSESTLQFKIHEGTVVRIYDERTNWAQIRLPGGLSGWIRRPAAERI
jgi:tetratricopeptide (TPR) repeat protein